jgi:hypothetical protein
MRYQQVYNSSLFSNASPGSIYVTTLTFYGDFVNPPSYGWIVPSMQINLSTTSKTADNLSMVFADNVGSDDTMVLAPTSYTFPGAVTIVFNRPFRYAPPLGNLLLDVRVFDGSGQPFPPEDPFPQMQALTSPTDEVSRVWSTNVMSATASGRDTIGLETLIELSPIPSLQARFLPFVCMGCNTNVIRISWPSYPTNFVLQTTRQLGSNASWGPATNQIFESGGRSIEIPAASAGAQSFYRLVWQAGAAKTQTVSVPGTPATATNQTTR